jgi:hypothetical protein
VLKCLTIVDDSTTEAVAVVLARALGGLPVTRVLDTRHVQDGRQLFREVLDGPIRFWPVGGPRAFRFEGKADLSPMFSGVATFMASPRGTVGRWSRPWAGFSDLAA